MELDRGVTDDVAAGSSDGGEEPRSSRKRKAASSAAKTCCDLCKEPGVTPKKWRGMLFDQRCWNAIRAHQRLLKTPEAKQADQRLLSEDPEAWRQRVLPLAALGDGDSRYIARKAAKKTIFEDEVTFKETSEINTDLMLNKNRFKAYMRFWENYGDESGSDSFQARLNESDSSHLDSDNEPRVRVKDNTRLQSKEGRAKRVGILFSNDDEPDQAEPRRGCRRERRQGDRGDRQLRRRGSDESHRGRRRGEAEL